MDKYIHIVVSSIFR